MSVITNLVLVFSSVDCRVVDDLVLGEYTADQRFVDVTEVASAGARGPSRKMLTIRIAATAVNYLGSLDDLIARMTCAPWQRPESVLLLVQGDGHLRPAVWGFAGARYLDCVEEPRRIECFLPAVPW